MEESSHVHYIPRVMIQVDGKTFVKAELDEVFDAIVKSSSSPGATVNVVSVVGAQGSGKSTLLNDTFGCRFDMLKDGKTSGQTTRGIWASDCNIPNLLVVDVEGCDGAERAEQGDESFARRAGLFALTLSHVMMFNIILSDVGRNEGGCLPLFRTIFKECVTLQQGKTRVLVVLRRHLGTISHEELEKQVMEILLKVWNEVNYPKGQKNKFPFSEYIDVKVTVLRDREADLKEFQNGVAELRNWFETEAFAGLHKHKETTAVFSVTAETLWKQILGNKQLDLPSVREMVSRHFCDQAKQLCLDSLGSDKDYPSLESGMTESPQEFSDKLESLLKRLTDRFEEETITCIEQVKDEKKKELIDEIIRKTSTYCRKLVDKLQKKVHSDSIKVIFSAIESADPTMDIDMLVNTHIQTFVQSCEVLKPRYSAIFSKDFESGLTEEAKELQSHMVKYKALEKQRQEAENLKEELKNSILVITEQLQQEKDQTRKMLEEIQKTQLEDKLRKAQEKADKYKRKAEREKERAERMRFPCAQM